MSHITEHTNFLALILLTCALTPPTPSQHHLIPQPPRVKYVGVNDQLILEDQVQRVTLTGNTPSRDLVTGVVMALLGRDLHNGCFNVEDYCFAGGTESVSVDRPVVTMDTDDQQAK